MKVIIELSDDIHLENIENVENEMKIIFKTIDGNATTIINIDNLRLALRKMTTK